MIGGAYVEPSHGDTDVEEDDTENEHCKGESGHHPVRDIQDLLLSSVGIDIFLPHGVLASSKLPRVSIVGSPCTHHKSKCLKRQ